MSSFNNISGNTFNGSAHFGDNYNSAESFCAAKEFSELEKQLVEIIYANTANDEERQQILDSLLAIKEEDNMDKEILLAPLNALLQKLKDIGEKAGIAVLTKFLTEKISEG